MRMHALCVNYESHGMDAEGGVEGKPADADVWGLCKPSNCFNLPLMGHGTGYIWDVTCENMW